MTQSLLATMRHRGTIRTLAGALLPALCAAGGLPSVHAATYGIYEARALAMGGAVVASAGTGEAHYYNPARIALHDGREEDGRDNRLRLSVLMQGAGPVDALLDFYEDELDVIVTDAVEAFNAEPGATSAEAVLSAIEDLDTIADELGEAPVVFDGHAGFAISLPGDREGGTFFISNRLVAVESAIVTAEDQAILEEYEQAMLFIASGGTEGSPGENVFEDGELLDPKDLLSSSSRVSAVAITEFGVALAREFELGGYAVAFGVTPKVQRLIVYNQEIDFSDEVIELDYTENADSIVRANLDLGVSAQVGEIYQLGLAVKDLVPDDHRLETGGDFSFRPAARLGGAMVTERYTVALDIDLLTRGSFMGEPESREIALGGAYRPASWVELRGGYRTDLEGDLPDALSLGAGLQAGRFVTDLAASFGDDFTGVALDLGWAF